MGTLIVLAILAIVNMFYLRAIIINSIKVSQRAPMHAGAHDARENCSAMGAYLPKSTIADELFATKTEMAVKLLSNIRA
jgi:hypothetical protein